MDNLDVKKEVATGWFTKLRDQICLEFQNIEKQFGSGAEFKREKWQHHGGGGGEISLMRGSVFEKVGVNVSTVYGEFSEKFADEIPGCAGDNRSYWATGISSVAHMNSPLIPTAHFNTRFISTQKQWFGGGCDLTPVFVDEAEKKFFHDQLEKVCNKTNKKYYPDFKKQCDEYFYLPHRGEQRGIGGIFFDYLNTENWQKDFDFIQKVGLAFKDVMCEIIRSKVLLQWDKGQKQQQLIKRGRYVEFNLLHDRGTKFGLMTGGDIDAIFMSLPPNVKW